MQGASFAPHQPEVYSAIIRPPSIVTEADFRHDFVVSYILNQNQQPFFLSVKQIEHEIVRLHIYVLDHGVHYVDVVRQVRITDFIRQRERAGLIKQVHSTTLSIISANFFFIVAGREAAGPTI
jgi:hypothetical protein